MTQDRQFDKHNETMTIEAVIAHALDDSLEPRNRLQGVIARLHQLKKNADETARRLLAEAKAELSHSGDRESASAASLADANAVQAWQIAEDDVRFFVPLADASQLERDLAEARAEIQKICQQQADADEADARSATALPLDVTVEMFAAYRGAIKEYIESFSEHEQKERWAADARGWQIPEAEKCAARWRAMVRAIKPSVAPEVGEPILDHGAYQTQMPRCEGRYPVPGPRIEPFDVTYRCALPNGHAGPCGAEPARSPQGKQVDG